MSEAGRTNPWMAAAIVFLIVAIVLGVAYVVAPRKVTTTSTVVSVSTATTTSTVERTVEKTVPTTVTSTLTTEVTKEITREVTRTETVTKTTTETRTTTKTTTVTETTTTTSTITTTVEKPKPLTLLELAEAIRRGEIDVGTTYGLALGQRFHNIHANVLGLACQTCHQASKYPEDYLYIRKYVAEKLVEEGKLLGVVDRGVCIGCHRQNSIARPFYMPFYGLYNVTSGASG